MGVWEECALAIPDPSQRGVDLPPGRPSGIVLQAGFGYISARHRPKQWLWWLGRAHEEDGGGSAREQRAVRCRSTSDAVSLYDHVAPGRGVYPSGTPDRASTPILGPRRRADNSGLSAYGLPAETHKCTAFTLIYLQNRRSTTELRPHAYLRLGSPKQAKMSSGQPPGNRTALVERLLFVTSPYVGRMRRNGV